MFFSSKPPRKFNYIPRYTKIAREGKIKFPRITFYEPRTKKPYLYLGLLLLLSLLYYYITGGNITFKAKPETIHIAEDNAVVVDTLYIDKEKSRP
jgi:quinol-cytochrome oxidoreductase complex cytochrome b subunit